MKRGKPLKRTPIRRRSKKKAARDRAFYAPGGPYEQALTRDRGQCRVAVLAYCTNRATTVHHVHPTGAGGTDDLSNLLSSCNECHHWIHHVDPRGARVLGVLI